MKIILDIDGVLSDWEGEFLNRWRKTHPDKKYIPLENREGFRISEQYPSEYLEHVRDIYNAPGFYENLPVMAGAPEALEELHKAGHIIYFCSSPMVPRYENCVLEKYHWVKENLGEKWIPRIILTKDKTLVKGDILIDDKPHIEGHAEPEWEHIIYDAAYNRHVENKKRITWDNWKEVLEI